MGESAVERQDLMMSNMCVMSGVEVQKAAGVVSAVNSNCL